jgi:hypothetical protein
VYLTAARRHAFSTWRENFLQISSLKRERELRLTLDQQHRQMEEQHQVEETRRQTLATSADEQHRLRTKIEELEREISTNTEEFRAREQELERELDEVG